jgi:hypothetical protein
MSCVCETRRCMRQSVAASRMPRHTAHARSQTKPEDDAHESTPADISGYYPQHAREGERWWRMTVNALRDSNHCDTPSRGRLANPPGADSPGRSHAWGSNPDQDTKSAPACDSVTAHTFGISLQLTLQIVVKLTTIAALIWG